MIRVVQNLLYIFNIFLFFFPSLSAYEYTISELENNNALHTSHYLSKFFEQYHLSDFDSAMYTSKRYKNYYERILQEADEALFIAGCKARYTFFCNQLERLWQEVSRIPKILHQIWLGPKPFPEEYKELTDILKKKHPHWIYKLWTNEDVEQFDLMNRANYEKTPSWAEKANLLRYELLFQFGGVYLDTDFECLKPLDFIIHCCDFCVGLEYVPAHYNKFIIGNAFIASRPKHILLATLIERISQEWSVYEPWSRIHQLERSGTRFFSRIIKECIDKCEGINIIFPANIFYPFTGTTILIQPETVGVHYWDSTWLKKKELLK